MGMAMGAALALGQFGGNGASDSSRALLVGEIKGQVQGFGWQFAQVGHEGFSFFAASHEQKVGLHGWPSCLLALIVQ
jgi:hypothetical protein